MPFVIPGETARVSVWEEKRGHARASRALEKAHGIVGIQPYDHFSAQRPGAAQVADVADVEHVEAAVG